MRSSSIFLITKEGFHDQNPYLGQYDWYGVDLDYYAITFELIFARLVISRNNLINH